MEEDKLIMQKTTIPPVITFVGSSGTGKTSLLEKLIPELKRRGLKIGTIKHSHHDVTIDQPGKDSWRHKQAGAKISIISAPDNLGMLMDVDHDLSVDEILPLMTKMDIVLAEGFKRDNTSKIEVFRPEINKEILCKDDPRLIAIISRHPVKLGIPRFGPDNVKEMADFLISYI